MTELEKIEYTKTFIDKLANGINPLTGEKVPENELINNVRVSRCLFYVSDLLRQMIEKSNKKSQDKEKKIPFSITHEEIERYEFSKRPISISEIARRITDLSQIDNMMQLKYRSITTFLMNSGFLQEEKTTDGKIVKRPTRKGIELGITVDERNGPNGPYYVVVYDNQAQKFIIDNIEIIVGLDNNKA